MLLDCCRNGDDFDGDDDVNDYGVAGDIIG